jgi:hypothetical protein
VILGRRDRDMVETRVEVYHWRAYKVGRAGLRFMFIFS